MSENPISAGPDVIQVAASQAGTFVATWSDALSGGRIRARVFELFLFKDNFESGDTSLWSSQVDASGAGL